MKIPVREISKEELKNIDNCILTERIEGDLYQIILNPHRLPMVLDSSGNESELDDYVFSSLLQKTANMILAQLAVFIRKDKVIKIVAIGNPKTGKILPITQIQTIAPLLTDFAVYIMETSEPEMILAKPAKSAYNDSLVKWMYIQILDNADGVNEIVKVKLY